MDLTKLTQDEKKAIVVTTNFDVDSFVKEYHEDKSICKPKIMEILSTEREPGNLVCKCVVYVKKENEIDIYHLEKMESLRKLRFIFWRAEDYG